MGAFGSGRPRTRTNGTVEGGRPLQIETIRRGGGLVFGRSSTYRWSRNGQEVAKINLSMGSDAMTLFYKFRRTGAEWEPVEQRVPIVWRPCRFGGQRPYYRCSGVVNGRHCNRTVTCLYGAGKYFCCRHCYRLSYGSQHEDRWDRASRRANKIRTRLGADPGGASVFPSRPKRMRHATYERMREAMFEAESQAEERLELLAARLLAMETTRKQRSRGRKAGFW